MKLKEMPYVRVEYEAFKKDFEVILDQFSSAQSFNDAKDAHKKYYEITEELSTSITLASIFQSIDTTDPFYEKEQGYYDEMGPLFDELNSRYNNAFLDSKFRDNFEKEVMGSLPIKNMMIDKKAFDEKIIPELQEINALSTKYQKLLASAKIDFRGEELNLPMLGKYMQDLDRDTRVEAFTKRTEFFMNNKEELDTIYDDLVRIRTRAAQKLGYENFIELGYYIMGRNCYDKDMVKNFRDQVKKYLVPLATRLYEEKRVRLGFERLTFMDEPINFTNGNPKPIGTPEEIFENGKKMYAQLSPETKEFFEFMLDNELFDVLSKKGKAGGGYCTEIDKYKSPFVFANFNGTSGDIDVLTHECGHAFEAYLARNMEVKEHKRIGMETAEVHSMSMEFFTESWMELFFKDRKDDYLYMHLVDAILFIPYGCMVDEFQHIVYEQPELTPAQRKEVWKKLESEYKPHLDYDGDPFFGEGGTWQRQAHIYEVPFYYIDYCLAQICALQFKVLKDRDFNEAWSKYLQFTKSAGINDFTTTLKQAGLKSPFEDGCVEFVVNGLEEYLK